MGVSLQELHDRIEMLEGMIGISTPIQIRLKNRFQLKGQRLPAVLGMLLMREFVSREQMYSALYGALPDHQQAFEKTLDAHICYLRKALAPHGVSIVTTFGQGWSIPRASKAVLKAALEPETEAA